MSNLLTAVIAAAFGLGLNNAIAQDLKSDQDGGNGQEKVAIPVQISQAQMDSGKAQKNDNGQVK